MIADLLTWRFWVTITSLFIVFFQEVSHGAVKGKPIALDGLINIIGRFRFIYRFSTFGAG